MGFLGGFGKLIGGAFKKVVKLGIGELAGKIPGAGSVLKLAGGIIGGRGKGSAAINARLGTLTPAIQFLEARVPALRKGGAAQYLKPGMQSGMSAVMPGGAPAPGVSSSTAPRKRRKKKSTRSGKRAPARGKRKRRRWTAKQRQYFGRRRRKR